MCLQHLFHINKTKQNKTKQNKIKQNKTKQNKIQIYLFCLTSYKGRLGDFKSSS